MIEFFMDTSVVICGLIYAVVPVGIAISFIRRK